MMEFVARVMANETIVIGLGVAAMILALVGIILLIVISVSAFVRRDPGGMLTLAGVAIIIAMFAFAQFETSTMEMQYGPSGSVVETAVYTYGGFLCVLGYARLTWHVFRNHRGTPS